MQPQGVGAIEQLDRSGPLDQRHRTARSRDLGQAPGQGEPLAGEELFWVDDAVDAFFLQIQGSGIVRLPDGSSRAVACSMMPGTLELTSRSGWLSRPSPFLYASTCTVYGAFAAEISLAIVLLEHIEIPVHNEYSAISFSHVLLFSDIKI